MSDFDFLLSHACCAPPFFMSQRCTSYHRPSGSLRFGTKVERSPCFAMPPLDSFGSCATMDPTGGDVFLLDCAGVCDIVPIVTPVSHSSECVCVCVLLLAFLVALASACLFTFLFVHKTGSVLRISFGSLSLCRHVPSLHSASLDVREGTVEVSLPDGDLQFRAKSLSGDEYALDLPLREDVEATFKYEQAARPDKWGVATVITLTKVHQHRWDLLVQNPKKFKGLIDKDWSREDQSLEPEDEIPFVEDSVGREASGAVVQCTHAPHRLELALAPPALPPTCWP